MTRLQEKAKEKAKELVEKHKDYVHGFVGSSMLTNHEYPEQILSQAKKCSLILVKECIDASQHEAYIPYKVPPIETKEFWLEVKNELEKIE